MSREPGRAKTAAATAAPTPAAADVADADDVPQSKAHPTDHYPDGHHPTEDELVATLRDSVDALATADVPYVLMGGVGATAWARPRITEDIDVFVRPEHAQPALDALAEQGFTTEHHDPHWLYKAWKRDVLVDVIFKSSGEIYLDDEMLARSRIQQWKGVEARVIAAEDLLVIKAVAAAEYSPHHWYDALSLIARTELDWSYLVARAKQAGPRRVLSLLLYAESNDLAVPAEGIEHLFATVHPPAFNSGSTALSAAS